VLIHAACEPALARSFCFLEGAYTQARFTCVAALLPAIVNIRISAWIRNHSMLTSHEQAQYLRSALVPYIQKCGVEQEFERHDGTKHRYREASLGGFIMRYVTPFHRNPQPMASCWDDALHLQAHPIEDYVLTVLFRRSIDDPARRNWVTMFNACWHSKNDQMRVSAFASDHSRWYDILLVALELASKAEKSQAGADEPTSEPRPMPAVAYTGIH
jgi:hypothetical protein